MIGTSLWLNLFLIFFFLCINHNKSCQTLWKILCSKTCYFIYALMRTLKINQHTYTTKKLFIHTLKDTILHIYLQLIRKCLYFKNVHILTYKKRLYFFLLEYNDIHSSFLSCWILLSKFMVNLIMNVNLIHDVWESKSKSLFGWSGGKVGW